MTVRFVALLALAGFVGCGDDSSESAFDRAQLAPLVVENAQAAHAVVSFTSDWSIDAPALTAGTTVAVDYDLARLPDCRGYRYGQPAWSVLMFWKVNDGPLQQQAVGGSGAPVGDALPAIELNASGTLQVWFLNSDAVGCLAWDSAFEHNHRFDVAEPDVQDQWVGAGATVISRSTCDGTPCDGTGRAITEGFTYDSWARQRATIASVYFEVWRPGVTDWVNPELWRELDVQVHWAWQDGTQGSGYVDHVDFVGNNARYAWPLSSWDVFRFGSGGCPSVATTTSEDGQSVTATVDYWIEVSGTRYPETGSFSGSFSDYASQYADCD